LPLASRAELVQNSTMNIDSFKETLAKDGPPELSHALRALWWDAKGDWDKAHASAQQDEQSPEGTWVHAYLHRKEGDLSNAGHWYRRAGQPVATTSLEAEWATIAGALLAQT
jgi:Tfp pilus assembly protein PilF